MAALNPQEEQFHCSSFFHLLRTSPLESGTETAGRIKTEKYICKGNRQLKIEAEPEKKICRW